MIVAILAEISIRVAFDDRFGVRPRFYIADDLLAWKAAANLDHTYYGRDFSCQIKTDADGYRLGALGETDYSKDLVLMVGDSYVFSWGVSTDETMPSYLDEALYAPTNGRVRVVNLGIGGYGTLQNFLRLRQFFENHPDARVAAIFVFHSPNDAVDNVQSIGCHIGTEKVTNKPMKARSRSHLANLIEFGIERYRTRHETPLDEVKDKSLHPFLVDNLVHSYFRDILFSHQFELPRSLPQETEFNGYPISFAGLSEEDFSKEGALRQGRFTRLHKNLIRVGVNSIHQLVAARDVSVFHIIVPTSTDDIDREFLEVLSEALPSGDNTVTVVGKYPTDLSDFKQEVISKHWARHYTPEFNKFWADRIFPLATEAVRNDR